MSRPTVSQRLVFGSMAALFGACAQQYTISTVAGGGPIQIPALNANIRLPDSLSVDSSGRYYIVAYARVFRVNLAGTIDFVVGNGTRSASAGDGGPASLAHLSNGAKGLAVDPEGNLYIGDVTRLRKVTISTGLITTIAGTGATGNTGDGGPAANATFSYIYGVARDAAGNLYIADSPNRRVRKIAAGTGIITTIAGGGGGNPGDGGLATSASLAGAYEVAVDLSGNILIADGARIRRVNASTGIISTVAGGGTGFPGDGGPATSASLFSARALALDASGNIYFSDYNKIRKITASTGILTTLANVNRSFGVASDGAGNILYSDTDFHQVRRLAAGAVTSTVVAGNGTPYFGGEGTPATNTALGFPNAVAFDRAGNMFVTDSDNQRVRKVAAGTGIMTTIAGTGASSSTGDGGPAAAATLNGPWALALDGNDNLYIAENYGHRIRKITASTGVISTVAGTGENGTTGDGGPATAAKLSQPTSIALDAAGNLYIGDSSERVRRVAASTGIITAYAGGGRTLIADGTPAAAGWLAAIGGLACDSAGNLYIASEGFKAIYRLEAATQTFTVIVAAFAFNGVSPGSIAVDRQGNIVFGAGSGSSELFKIWKIPAGTRSPSAIAGVGVEGNSGDGGPALSARFSHVFDVAHDPAGSVYLVDSFYGRVRKLTPNSAAPPPAPALISPAQNATNVSSNARLTWTPSTGATHYEVRFGPANPPPLHTTTSFESEGLGSVQNGGTYFWQVVAIGPGGTAASEIRSFQIAPASAPPGPVSSLSPASGATGLPLRVNVSWTSAGATSHEIYFPDNATLLATVTSPAYTLTGLSPSTTYSLRIVSRNASGSTQAITSFTTQAAGPAAGNFFVPVTPCRLADTRASQGTSGNFGPPSLAAGAVRQIPVMSGRCNIPDTATAYSFNLTVVPRGPLGFVTLWPAGQAQPTVSTLNALHGGILANAAIVPAGFLGGIQAYVTDATDLILDINGYFAESGGDAFTPLDPCRLVDTRNNSGFTGLFGAPNLAATTSRSFPLASGACGLPANASSFSLNATVVPPGPLGFLTLWPSGQTQPVVSTLNNLDGTVLANAALVPAGSQGGVTAFANSPTQLILDVNGYFRPASVPGGLAFFPVTPCRVADTRLAGNGAPRMNALETRAFAVAGKCGIPSTARAYSTNVTVVPQGPLGYLSMWPAGRAQPVVSTLNSLLGRILANAAIIPAGTGGQVNVFVTDHSHVILDVNGYFQ
jgi:sugar lactone lactonase YvrE